MKCGSGLFVGEQTAGQRVVDRGGGGVGRVCEVDAGRQHRRQGVAAGGESAVEAVVGALGERLLRPPAAQAVLRHRRLPGTRPPDDLACADGADLGFDRGDQQSWGEGVNGPAPYPGPRSNRAGLDGQIDAVLGDQVAGKGAGGVPAGDRRCTCSVCGRAAAPPVAA
jgi:hypothetical protein